MLPLDGVRVVDAAGAIGAYCSKLLFDLGADVVVVEPEGGHEHRRLAPFQDATGASLGFAAYHAGKQVVPAAELERVAADADVVIVSAPAPWAPASAIVCSITPYGLDGPRAGTPATPLTSFAVTGAMHRIGPPEGPPLAVPGQFHWDVAGTHAAIAVVAALLARPRVGPQAVDVSAQEVESASDFHLERYDVAGPLPGARSIAVGFPPTGNWQCADGVLDISCHQAHHWTAFLAMLDDPDELSEPALRDMSTRRDLAEGLSETIAALLRPHKRLDLVAKGQACGLPAAALNTPQEFVADEQLAARGSLIPVTTPETGEITLPASPVCGSVPLTRSGRVTLPQDGRGEPGEPAALPDRHGDGVLAGLRVLTFGAFVAGNGVGTLLASLGADVAKIEPKSRPEVLRNPGYGFTPEVVTEPSGVVVTPMSATLTRGLRGLALDAETPDGLDLFLRLVAEADVVVENFGIRTLTRWGCDFERLSAVNPRLVMVSLSGYGRSGPRAPYLAYAANISNFTGLTKLWANAGTLSDYATAAHGALGVLAARRLIERGSPAIHVDVCQIEVMAALLAPLLAEPLVNGRDALPPGNRVPGALLSGVFPCHGEDRWVAVQVDDDAQLQSLARVLGTDTPDADAITAWTLQRSHHTAAHLLARAGVPAGAVQDDEDVSRDPQLWHRRFPATLDHPDLGTIVAPAGTMHLDRTPSGFSRLGPRVGEHTDDILRRWLGVDDSELSKLEGAGAIFRA